MDTLYHISTVHDESEGEIEIYVNGTLESTTSSTSNSGNKGSNSWGSKGHINEDNFGGMIDELHIAEGDAWDSTEVSNLFSENTVTSTAADNLPPSLSNLSPSDGSTDISSETDLCADYSDPNVDSGTVSFYWQNGTQIQENTGVSSGTTSCTSNLDLKGDATYNWYVEANDGNGGSTNAGNYSFSTQVSLDNPNIQSCELWFRIDASSEPLENNCGSVDGDVDGNAVFGVDGITRDVGDWGLGKAISLDGAGSDDGINVSRNFVYDEMTIAAWIKTNEDGDVDLDEESIFHKGASYILRYNIDNEYEFFATIDGTQQTVSYDRSLNASTWYHVVGEFDGSEMRLYINGSLKNSKDVSGTVDDTSSQYLKIGKNGKDPATGINGTIDEPHIYSKSLGQNGVEDLYRFNTLSFVENLSLSSLEASDNRISTADTSFSLDSTGGASDVDVKTQYRKQGNTVWQNSSVQTVSSTGTNTFTLSGLEKDTVYEYRGWADNSTEIATTSISKFQTSGVEWVVDSQSEWESSTGSSNGLVALGQGWLTTQNTTSSGSFESIERGFGSNGLDNAEIQFEPSYMADWQEISNGEKLFDKSNSQYSDPVVFIDQSKANPIRLLTIHRPSGSSSLRYDLWASYDANPGNWTEVATGVKSGNRKWNTGCKRNGRYNILTQTDEGNDIGLLSSNSLTGGWTDNGTVYDPDPNSPEEATDPGVFCYDNGSIALYYENGTQPSSPDVFGAFGNDYSSISQFDNNPFITTPYKTGDPEPFRVGNRYLLTADNDTQHTYYDQFFYEGYNPKEFNFSNNNIDTDSDGYNTRGIGDCSTRYVPHLDEFVCLAETWPEGSPADTQITGYRSDGFIPQLEVGVRYDTTGDGNFDKQNFNIRIDPSYQFDGDGKDVGMTVPSVDLNGTVYEAKVNLSYDAKQGLDEFNITSVVQNTLPTASLTANSTSIQEGDTVGFDASDSSDSDGLISSYDYDPDGDGTYEATGAGSSYDYQYQSTGTFDAAVRVTDNGSATDTGTVSITVDTNESYVTDLPAGISTGLEADLGFNPASQPVTRGSTQSVVFGSNLQDEIAAGLQIKFDSNVSQPVLDAGVNRDSRKTVIEVSSDSAIQSSDMYIPRENNSGKIRICPLATGFGGVYPTCTGGYNISTGETINGVTLSEVSLAGYDYYKAAGVSGTGGLEYNVSADSGGGDGDGGSGDGGSGSGGSGSSGGGTSGGSSGSSGSDTEDQDSGSNETVVHSWKLKKPTQLGLSEGLTVGSSGRFRTAVQVVNNGEDNVSIQVRCESEGPACGWVTTLPTTVNVQSGESRRVVVEGRVSPNASTSGFVSSITSPPSYPFTVEAVDQSDGVDGASESVDMTVKVSSGYDVLTKPIQSTTISAGGPGVGVPNLVWALLAAVSWIAVFYLGVENIVQREKMPRSRYGTTAVIFVMVLLAI